MRDHTAAPAHGADRSASTSARIAIALSVTLAFVIVEGLAGLGAHSLALLSDAGHNLTDVVALGLSWYAVRIAARPADAGKTFGYHRAGILVALVNSTVLVLIALAIFYQAYQRFLSAPAVQANVLAGVGLLAILVNAGTAWLVHSGSQDDLNLRSSFIHLAGDVLAALGAVLAGVAIAVTHFNWLDPLVGVLIGLLILWNAWGILRQTVDILLESVPRDIDMAQLVRDLQGIAGVQRIHDLHVWSITQSLRALSVHIVTDDVSLSSGAGLQHDISALVGQKYNIAHATIQLECVGCEPATLYCDMTADLDAAHSLGSSTAR